MLGWFVRLSGFASKDYGMAGRRTRIHVLASESWRSWRSLRETIPLPTLCSLCPLWLVLLVKLGSGQWKGAVYLCSQLRERMMAYGKVKVWIAMAIGLGALNLGSEEVDLNLPEGFEAHRIYDVPVKTQGSWVCITFDPQGRLIASSQFGGLYRLTLPPIKEDTPPLVETMDVDVGAAQGLLWAFDSLYVVVNGTSKSGRQSGLYRVWDSDGDDRLDEVSLLRRFDGAGEHGPHALSLTPDGKRIFVLAGNATEIPEPLDDSRVPQIWADDHILPREQYRDSIIGPDGAWVCITDLDGKYWELFCRGMRNPYDIALDRGGNLFTWDSDNERDTGQPWYRPTRVCFLASGGDYGWRSGSGKWPKYYKDSLPPAVEMGTGSPTGIVFGYGTHFPAKYREALFVLDWSFGSIEAVFPEPNGAGFTGRSEVFASSNALPVTDVAVGRDGALYFTTGGRGMDSFLYRIRHRSPDFDEVDEEDGPQNELAAIRRELDSHHVSRDPAHVDKAWPHLGSGDRFVAASARTILEHHEPDHWRERVFEESDPMAKVNGLIALARTGKKRDQVPILHALNRMEVESLDEQGILDLLRAYQLSFTRFGKASNPLARATAERLENLFPSDTFFINRELSRLLVYLESPQVIATSLDLLTKGRTQEEQIHFALVLRLGGNRLDPRPEKDLLSLVQSCSRILPGWGRGCESTFQIRAHIQTGIRPNSIRCDFDPDFEGKDRAERNSGRGRCCLQTGARQTGLRRGNRASLEGSGSGGCLGWTGGPQFFERPVHVYGGKLCGLPSICRGRSSDRPRSEFGGGQVQSPCLAGIHHRTWQGDLGSV